MQRVVLAARLRDLYSIAEPAEPMLWFYSSHEQSPYAEGFTRCSIKRLNSNHEQSPYAEGFTRCSIKRLINL